MIHEKQAQALANLLHQIRGAWSIPSMMKLLSKHADHPATFAEIASAAITAANDDKVTAPGIIFIDSRFWPEPAKAKLPPAPDCPDHIGKPAHNCAGCWADVKAGDRLPHQIGQQLHPDPGTNPTTRYHALMNKAAGIDLRPLSIVR